MNADEKMQIAQNPDNVVVAVPAATKTELKFAVVNQGVVALPVPEKGTEIPVGGSMTFAPNEELPATVKAYLSIGALRSDDTPTMTPQGQPKPVIAMPPGGAGDQIPSDYTPPGAVVARPPAFKPPAGKIVAYVSPNIPDPTDVIESLKTNGGDQTLVREAMTKTNINMQASDSATAPGEPIDPANDATAIIAARRRGGNPGFATESTVSAVVGAATTDMQNKMRAIGEPSTGKIIQPAAAIAAPAGVSPVVADMLKQSALRKKILISQTSNAATLEEFGAHETDPNILRCLGQRMDELTAKGA